MKITIITVCYNSAQTLERTIQSVASQTYPDIEYIVIDGNSKDSTIDIIKKHEKSISEWVSEPDKGLYEAMNKGIQLATGDIIGILNSDDIFYDEDVLDKIANFHLKNEIDASVGNIVQYNEEGKLIRRYGSKNWNPEKLKIGYMPPHPAIFFRATLFKELGNYQTDFTIGGDYELIIRFFLKNGILWKYSGITTTAMLVGGISTLGIKSYLLISKEVIIALKRNEIKFSPLKVKLRGIWKLAEYLKRK